MMETDQVDGTLIARLEALAQTLEGQGQYNVAKLARAAGASLVRSSARGLEVDSSRESLSAQVESVAGELSDLQLDPDLVQALRSGSQAIAEGRLAMIDETPHPYVCRTCGHVALAPPGGNCPRCNARPRTYQRFPPVYWLEAMDPMEAIHWLRRTPEQVSEMIEGVGEEELSREVVEGEWSVRDLLTHLRDAQGVLDFRVNLLVEEENPTIESKAVFEWATDDSARPATSREIFDTYRSSRRQTLEVLERIPLSEWWREGKHQEFGVVSIKQQASYFATHELTHLPQIQFLLGEAAGR